MAVDHARIARLLGDETPDPDHSLRAHSLRRATSGEVPHTLTPYEWEQWYALHGKPESHTDTRHKPSPSWWQRLIRRNP